MPDITILHTVDRHWCASASLHPTADAADAALLATAREVKGDDTLDVDHAAEALSEHDWSIDRHEIPLPSWLRVHVALWQLAEDAAVYGPRAGWWILTSPDGEVELAGPFPTVGDARAHARAQGWVLAAKGGARG